MALVHRGMFAEMLRQPVLRHNPPLLATPRLTILLAVTPTASALLERETATPTLIVRVALFAAITLELASASHPRGTFVGEFVMQLLMMYLAAARVIHALPAKETVTLTAIARAA